MEFLSQVMDKGTRMPRSTKAGFTLIELMVYIALLGGIVLIAGQAFSDSTKMRMRTQSMLQANQYAGNVGSILKEDITQLGAKSTQEVAAVGATMDAFNIHDVYIDAANEDLTKRDSSSYNITNNHSGTDLDSLTFRRVRYDQDGHYVATEEISWFVEENELKRGCKTLAGTADNDLCQSGEKPSIVTMVEGIQRFNIIAAEPGATETTSRILPEAAATTNEFRLIPRYGDYNFAFTEVDPVNGGAKVTLSGFSTNYDFQNQQPITDGKNANQVFYAPKNDLSGTWSERCTPLTFEQNTEYEISFSMPINTDDSRLFSPDRDYMSVGFRRINDATRPSELIDFSFFPPTRAGASEGTRKFRFRTKNKVENVCMAFTFASYSPVVASGKISFSDIVLKKVESANYTFSGNEIDITEKKNVKALKVEFAIGVRGESSATTLIIPIPSNGLRD